MRQFIKKNIWAVAPVVFVLVALVLLGSPFGSGNVQETPAEDDNLIVVGVSQVGSESVWRTAHTQSVQDQDPSGCRRSAAQRREASALCPVSGDTSS